MNKTAIKNFAIWARRELIEKVTKKAKIYGIKKDKEMKEMDTALNGQVLTSDDKKARRILIEKIDKDGFDETIEEVAYTWFNRFIAIRFMEVNGYMPSHIRVFTSEKNEFEPQILSEAIHMDLPGLDKSKVLELYNAGNKEEELFNYLFITQCNALNEVLPGMFQKLNDYTELLLPDGLLREDSVLGVMIREIPEEDWKEQVQIIGWLYQYYISEQKESVFTDLKRNIKVSKDNIPAATQLFTPDWIVRYMVENSLGRLWIEGHPDEELKENWKYYLEEAEQEKEVQEKLEEIKKKYAGMKPEDIKCIDPAIGSGHIGAYLFDVLIQIYESCGYNRRDAVRLILENNIYGLDIDERARQLAYFSLMMKARQYDRRFLSRSDIPQPKIYAIEESNFFKTEDGKNVIEYFADGDKDLKKDINSLVEDMIDAKEYGSIVIVKPVNFEAIYNRLDEIRNEFTMSLDSMLALEQLLPLVEQTEILSSEYDVVITNPPYMGKKSLNSTLSNYMDKYYEKGKSELYSTFILKCMDLTKRNGYMAMITIHTWMFISSFENLREEVLNRFTIDTMVHTGAATFEELNSFNVLATSFCLRKTNLDNYSTLFIRLADYYNTKEKICNYKNKENRFKLIQKEFYKIPGKPFVYWISEEGIKNFEIAKLVKDYADIKVGLQTGNNKQFVRFWHEVNFEKTFFNAYNNRDSIQSKAKWFPYNKGGRFRKWYGMNEYVVNWEHGGNELKNFKGAVLRNQDYYFKEGITWSLFGFENFAVRYKKKGFLFDVSGSSMFPSEELQLYILAFLTSKVAFAYLSVLAPTVNFQAGNIGDLPLVIDYEVKNEIELLAKECIKISKEDWDSYEESWDFKKDPLLKYNSKKIEDAYKKWEEETNYMFEKIRRNEERINELFIEVYKLEKDITPEVIDRDIAIKRAEKKDVVKNFLSYFIGCAMGRYSLDEEGLVLAGGGFDSSKYISFKADKDGILPITDQEYFEDDIVELFVGFLKVTFGEENLNENLDFIASELKGKKSDSSRERIRNYFLNDFYKDHCKMYQKLPIYWQYDSGKNDACRGLFYLHRYDKDMFAKIRINYVFEVQDRYKQELVRVEDTIAESSGNKKIELQKRADALKKKIIESQQFEEKAQHIADSYIEIDLDDGVKENYKIFKDVLAKIK